MKLPPQIKIETISQEILAQGFLGIDRRKVRIIYPVVNSRTIEDQFMTIDSVIRKCNDAVCIIAYFKLNDEVYIYLRSCLRPAAMLRDYWTDSERLEPEERNGLSVNPGNLFELPAGLIDEYELGSNGPVSAAQRELLEEIGIDVNIDDLYYMGRYFSSAGMCAERVYFYQVQVDPFTEQIPGEDGSALEMGGEVIKIKLTDALKAINTEEILDAKTQMGIMKLAKKLNV